MPEFSENESDRPIDKPSPPDTRPDGPEPDDRLEASDDDTDRLDDPDRDDQPDRDENAALAADAFTDFLMPFVEHPIVDGLGEAIANSKLGAHPVEAYGGWSGVVDHACATAYSAKEAAGEKLEQVTGAVSDRWTQLTTAADEVATDLRARGNLVAEGLSEKWEDAKETAGEAWDHAKERADEVEDRVEDAAERLGDAFRGRNR